MNPTIKQSFVYVILEAGKDGRCKLGVSRDVESRRKELQVGNSRKLTTIAQWPAPLALETILHKHFHQYKREGEWFALPPFCGLEILNLIRCHPMHSSPTSNLESHVTYALDIQVDHIMYRYEIDLKKCQIGYRLKVRERERFGLNRSGRTIANIFLHRLTSAEVQRIKSGRITGKIETKLKKLGTPENIITSITTRPGKGRSATSRTRAMIWKQQKGNTT